MFLILIKSNNLITVDNVFMDFSQHSNKHPLLHDWCIFKLWLSILNTILEIFHHRDSGVTLSQRQNVGTVGSIQVALVVSILFVDGDFAASVDFGFGQQSVGQFLVREPFFLLFRQNWSRPHGAGGCDDAPQHGKGCDNVSNGNNSRQRDSDSCWNALEVVPPK